MKPALPPFFRSLRALRWMNAVGVGCALGAVVGVWCGQDQGGGYFSEPAALASALSTLLVATAWVEMLRRTSGPHRMRSGCLLSIPLAILNTALAVALLSFPKGLGQMVVSFLGGLVLSATFGVFFWVPALLFTLVVFGLPIAWSQRLASRGLAGEERGEAVIGGAVVVLSTLALLLGVHRPPSTQRTILDTFDDIHDMDLPRAPLPELTRRGPDTPATWTLAVLGASGLLLGGTAIALSLRRERRRRRFVAQAEAGQVPGYRVDATDEGKVLVRVALLDQPGVYRAPIADEEELFALDEQNHVAHPRRALGAEQTPPGA